MDSDYFVTKMHCECKKLFVGDPCYALKDEIYDGVWGKTEYQNGVIQDENHVYGVVTGTREGDGDFKGGDGTNFVVDSGVLGIVNMDFKREYPSLSLGKVVNLPSEDVYVSVSYDDGIVYITIALDSTFMCSVYNVAINTIEDEEDEDDRAWWNEKKDEDEE